MLTEARTLYSIADALDAFPHLDSPARAHIFHAIDTAPNAQSWGFIKDFTLSGPDRYGSPLTLHEASGWCGDPSGDEILKSLHRAEELLK